MNRLVWKKSCDTCRRFKAALDEAGVSYDGREMNAAPLDAAEVRALVEGIPVKDWLNPRNELYRERGFAREMPTADEAIALAGVQNNLIRRPVFVVGGEARFGEKAEAAIQRARA